MESSKRFEALVSNTIMFETGGDKSGAYTDDPNDSGGATKWGISQVANPDVKIKTLTYKQAIQIYKARYWNPFYDFITDDSLAFKLFDMGVLMGVETSVKLLQKAIVEKGGILTRVDGNFGPMTLTAIATINQAGNTQVVYDYYIDLLKSRVTGLCMIPKNWKYRIGWMSRVLFNVKDKVNATV